VDPRKLGLQFAHFGGEPWTEDMRVQIEREMGLLAFNNYGLSEVMGPGVSGECGLRTGMHIQEDHFLVECLDPVTLEPVKDGEKGELVFTTLTKEAMPVLRYRTRDIATLDRGPCACGRVGARMSRVVGRTDDMLIIRGVNVFPSQIEEMILKQPKLAPHYVLEVSRPEHMDELDVLVEMKPEFAQSPAAEQQAAAKELQHHIKSYIGVSTQVRVVAQSAIERSIGKAKRVIDKRPK
jgi:phenylacetate-CoA ligase